MKAVVMGGAWLRCAALAVGLAVPLACGAQAVEKNAQFSKVIALDLSRDNPAGKLPRGFSEQVTGALQVAYAYGAEADGARYLSITLTNRSRHEPGHYALFAGEMIPERPGVVYRVRSVLQVERGRFQGGVGIGCHVFGPGGDYLTEFATPTSRADVYRADRQTLTADYVGGTVLERAGVVPSALWPRLSVINVLPDKSLTIRLYGLSIEQAEIRGTGIVALPVKQSLPDGGVLKVSVNLLTKPVAGDPVATLRLVDSAGKVKYQASHAASKFWSGMSGSVLDAWQFKLPPNEGAADQVYKITYELKSAATNAGLRLIPLSGEVAEQESGGKYVYTIGSVAVGPSNGALIGASFHHYPASTLGDSRSSIGDVKLKYRFSRSFANDHTMVPWWSFSGRRTVYDWGAFERWALKFSREGDKSLLIVFNGTPTSGSSDVENRNNPLGRPGWSAPPKDLKKFEQVVFDTVSRYKDRVFAVECLNEPDVPGFFSGTSTDMANICKNLYQAVKRVDAKIPVICPQTPNPDAMGYVLNAKTSEGEPVTNYCDWIGAHIYQGIGRDINGKAFSAESLSDQVALIRRQMAVYGLVKPIAVTEFGIDRCSTNPAAGRGPLDQLPDAQKAEAVYQSIATLVENGVNVIALYSYDLAYVNTNCFKGGYLWTTNPGVTAINEPVVRRINDAVSDFGAKRAAW